MGCPTSSRVVITSNHRSVPRDRGPAAANGGQFRCIHGLERPLDSPGPRTRIPHVLVHHVALALGALCAVSTLPELRCRHIGPAVDPAAMRQTMCCYACVTCGGRRPLDDSLQVRSHRAGPISRLAWLPQGKSFLPANAPTESRSANTRPEQIQRPPRGQ